MPTARASQAVQAIRRSTGRADLASSRRTPAGTMPVLMTTRAGRGIPATISAADSPAHAEGATPRPGQGPGRGVALIVGLSPGGSKLDVCEMTMTGRATHGRPE